MGFNGPFNFRRIYIGAPRNNHVFQTAHDGHMSVRIQLSQVSGVKPAVHNSLGRCLRFVQIARTYIGASQEDLSFFPRGDQETIGPYQFDIHVGHGVPYGTQFSVGHEAVGSHLGKAVTFPDVNGFFFLKGLKEGMAQGGPAGNHEPDPGKIGGSEFGGVHEHLEHGGNAEKDGYSLLLDQIQDQVRIKAPDQDVGPPALEDGQGKHVPPCRIEHGRVKNGLVFGTEAPTQLGVDGVPGEHPMGQKDPLWDPCGAGGVDDQLGIVGQNIHFRRGIIGQGIPDCGQGSSHGIVIIQADKMGYRNQILEGGYHILVLPIKEHGPGGCIFQKIDEFISGQAEIQGDKNRSEATESQEKDDIFGSIQRQTGYPVTFFDSQVPAKEMGHAVYFSG